MQYVTSVASRGIMVSIYSAIMRAKKLTNYVKLIGEKQSQTKNNKESGIVLVLSNAYDKIKRHSVLPHLLASLLKLTALTAAVK